MAEPLDARPDYYAALGVARDADALAVKVAYRRLAMRWHPDRHAGDHEAEEAFRSLVEAYGVLGDEARRQAYDAGRPSGGRVVEPGTPLEELFGRVVDQLFGVKARGSSRGRDRSYRLTLTLAEAALGTTRTLTLPWDSPCGACDGRGFPLSDLPEICPRCAGEGELQVRRALRSVVEACPDCEARGHLPEVRCKSCSGSGTRSLPRDVDIQVPAGVEDGARLVVRGAGEAGAHGGPSGDCLVTVAVAPHPTLRRAGSNITCERPVPVLDALIGAWVRVPTLEGPRRVRMPPESREGDVLRLEALGGRRSDGSRGDQLVTVRLELPSGLDEDARDVLRSARDALGREAFAASHAFDQDLETSGTDEPA